MLFHYLIGERGCPSETIDKYVTDLRKLASTCNFDGLKDFFLLGTESCVEHKAQVEEKDYSDGMS